MPIKTGKYFKLPENPARKLEGGKRLKDLKQSDLSQDGLVTIITVSKDSSRTIEKTIESVKNQTYQKIEYIVIDACSTDGTLDILKKNETFIDYFVSEPDSGLYNAMNKGLALAQGEFILILNSDDWYRNDCVEKLVQARENAGADFSSALATYVNGKGKKLYTLQSMLFDGQTRLRMPLRHELMLVPAYIYNAIGGYDETLRIISDLEFTARLFENNYALAEIEEPLLYFRNDGISGTQVEKLVDERRLLIKRQFTFLEEDEIEWLSENKTKLENIKNLLIKYKNERKLVQSLLDMSRRLFPEFPESDFVKSNYPRISVVVAVYNAGKTLRNSLLSVLNQSYKNFEIICVNDGSSDDSLRILEELKSSDKRIVIINNPKNVGLGQSRNHGIRNSIGKYIFHMDPDDTLPADSLELLESIAEKRNSDIVKGRFIRLNSEQQPIGESRKIFENSKYNVKLEKYSYILKTTEGHWSCLYRNEISKKISYPVDMKMGQDTLFLTRAFYRSKKISLTNSIVYNYVVHNESTMNNYNLRKLLDDCRWRQRVFNLFGSNRKLKNLAGYYIQKYWNDRLLVQLNGLVSKDDCMAFFSEWHQLMRNNNIKPSKDHRRLFFSQLVALIYRNDFQEAYDLIVNTKELQNSLIKKRPLIVQIIIRLLPNKIKSLLYFLR